MNAPRDTLRRILGPTGRDAGCEHSLELADEFVELELRGGAAREAFPDVATHLDACPDCREDYAGLRELAGGPPGGAQEGRRRR